MTLNKTIFLTSLLSAMILATGLVSLGEPADAQTTALRPTRQANIRHFTPQQATATQTFATTTLADLVGTQITFTPMRLASNAEAPGTPNPTDRFDIRWTADVSKATATTGSCEVYINGAPVAGSERFISSAAGRGTISGELFVVNTLSVSTVAKLQCHSGDTNTFTVNTAQMVMEEIY